MTEFSFLDEVFL